MEKKQCSFSSIPLNELQGVFSKAMLFSRNWRYPQAGPCQVVNPQSSRRSGRLILWNPLVFRINFHRKNYRISGGRPYWSLFALGGLSVLAGYSFHEQYDPSWLLLPCFNAHILKSSERPFFFAHCASAAIPQTHSTKQESSFTNKNLSKTCCAHPLWRSNEKKPFEKKYDETAIFSGTSNSPLAKSIAHCLGMALGKIHVSRFADGEVNLQFQESLRGKDVYIVQPTSTPVNEHLVELLLLVSTARRSSAKKITAVIPYYGYARQDRKLNSRVPISAADVARMIENAGADRVISVDLHCGQIQGFFGPRVPVDNLEAQIIGIDHFANKKLHKPVIVSPDAGEVPHQLECCRIWNLGGVYRARKFQQSLQAHGIHDAGLAMIVKQRIRANEIERMDLVGNVEGCDVIVVDDMIDTAGTLCEAAKQLKSRGAKRVFAFATHGLFSYPALKRIEESSIEEIIVCDTIKPRPEILQCKRIRYLSTAPLIADAIRRIHQKESLQQLFVAGA